MSEHHHYRIFKPWGYLSQFIYNGKRASRKKLLGELYDFAEGTMAIGRLDEDSEGLLLLTTNGKVSFDLLTKKFEKEYYVQVDGIITAEAVELMQNGLKISAQGTRYTTKNCKVCQIETPTFPERGRPIRDERHGPTSWVSIILREGKFRQVRKMTAAVGFPTLRLVRVRIGDHQLGDMQPGEVAEVEKLIEG